MQKEFNNELHQFLGCQLWMIKKTEEKAIANTSNPVASKTWPYDRNQQFKDCTQTVYQGWVSL